METQALTNDASGEDENEEEMESEARPAEAQTSLEASADGQVEQEVGGTQDPRVLRVLTLLSLEVLPVTEDNRRRSRGGDNRAEEFRE